MSRDERGVLPSAEWLPALRDRLPVPAVELVGVADRHLRRPAVQLLPELALAAAAAELGIAGDQLQPWRAQPQPGAARQHQREPERPAPPSVQCLRRLEPSLSLLHWRAARHPRAPFLSA